MFKWFQDVRTLKRLIRSVEADGLLSEDELRRLHQQIMHDGAVTGAERHIFEKALKRLKPLLPARAKDA